LRRRYVTALFAAEPGQASPYRGGMGGGIGSWLSGPSGERAQPYPGEALGLPERGPRSLAPTGRRLAALLVDWLLAYGIAALGMTLGLISFRLLSWAVLAIWLILGVLAVRLFEFTPGQFTLGLKVISIDKRMHVGIGRAVVRGVLITFVIPALFVDVDGRGVQDRVTATAVVRR
jgi:hypothetical protein